MKVRHVKVFQSLSYEVEKCPEGILALGTRVI